MNYTRYSKEEFEKKGHGTEEAFLLAEELKKEVLDELMALISPRMSVIARELRNLGHDLTQGPDESGCVCFREEGEAKNRLPGLILAVDVVISTGYPNTLRREDSEEIMGAVRETLGDETKPN
jgi:hypothetical protein